MRNVKDDDVEEVMWQQCSEATVQLYAEFTGRLVWKMEVSLHTASNEYNPTPTT
jgi:hypothetical protein